MEESKLISLYTESGENLPSIPWNIYPRPKMVRDSFICLNGEWDLTDSDGTNEKITVPFPPESILSGVGRRMGKNPHIIYKKRFALNEELTDKKVLLHFGAVDQIAKVELNGAFLGEHIGGYEHFSFDITESVKEDNELTVTVTNAEDPLSLPYGKQCEKRGGMWYTPVTGIWQTVWIEIVPTNYITDVAAFCEGNTVTIKVGGVDQGRVSIDADGVCVFAELVDGKAVAVIENIRYWSPDDPYLYRFCVETNDDKVNSYFSVRTFSVDEVKGKKCFCLNGRPYFLHGVLDQGYFSDGIFTPAVPEEYKNDILLVKELGFNMIRKHIKIEPDIFYYYCDLYGMTVVQDMVNNGDYSFIRDTALPTVGLKRRNDKNLHKDKKTREAFERGMVYTVTTLDKFNSIVGWTIFNEGWGQFCSEEMYKKLRELDKTRFVDSASGWFVSDVNEVESLHVYFKPVKLAKEYSKPVFLSEFGGYSYRIEGHITTLDNEYGYKIFKTQSDFDKAFGELYENEIIPAVDKGLCGTVYTQLSDVEDETNGLITYDRRVIKVDKNAIKQLSQKLFEKFNTQFE